jgi:hypothetical protein
MSGFRRRRFLSLFLALSLALAPLFSAAHTAIAAAAPPDAHAQSSNPHAHHAAKMSTQGDQTDFGASRCATHDSCTGQCCAGCGHCATSVLILAVVPHPVRPVQTPVVLILRLSDLPAVQNRPPQV